MKDGGVEESPAEWPSNFKFPISFFYKFAVDVVPVSDSVKFDDLFTESLSVVFDPTYNRAKIFSRDEEYRIPTRTVQ